MDGVSPNSGPALPTAQFSCKPNILATEYNPKGAMRNLLSNEHNSLDSCPVEIQGVLGMGKEGELTPLFSCKHSKPYLAINT